MMNNSVEVAGLVVRRGGTTVLPGLDLAITAGSITGLLGPSGSGKTTLIRCIAGVQAVRSGTVTVLGEPAGSAANRARVGYVTQASSVYPDLTIEQNLRFFADLAGAEHDRIAEVLDAVDLAAHRRSLADNLSGGQRTRVSLAAALVADPQVYLLDEPTVGLDPALRRDLWHLFADLAHDGATLLVSSHVMDEAARCDRVLLLREGRLIADATPQGLRADAGTDDLDEAFLRIAERKAA
ncbi:heme ABC exporter ATP-binding protein CcmA [Aeromicrobium phragmitis]|uniref:Heme ABC exporter ATP-binding protein CcmA n=1 Tax=Aeromicrobium phragmitis TaxID=2478914 RepID=A0A3L8PLE5_9ACTN|nr:heme ABC exporter ATP-binding protein CcmA [Aeromicrobium phragmitis]RLV56135.1 heme ABC exporter ATP-binding protein CcmA [Aeromicrobium phragmitis]